MGSSKKYNRLILSLAVIVILAFAQNARGSDLKPSEINTIRNVSEEKQIHHNRGEAEDHYVIVYYFHGKFRCHTCKRIEQLTRKAVREFFEDEMGTGEVKLKIINVEEKENRHFTKNYKLFTRSVVISDIVNGKEKQWKNLQKVWELIYDEKAFKEYIRSEVKAYFS